MAEKIALVTGANAGLGYQVALGLARAGTTVIMACRNLEKAEDAHRQLQTEVPDARSKVMQLDVSEPDSIREFGRRFAGEFDALDLLINNAGVFEIPLARNSAGYEMHLATNYLGPFLLTGVLLPHFRSDGRARIVNVGSLSHRFGKLPLDNLNWADDEYDKWQAYARSKLALLTYTQELNRRLLRQGSGITALAAHPGFAVTEGAQRRTAMVYQSRFRKWLADKGQKLVPPASDSARAILHAACAEDVRGGEYYGPGGLFEIAGKPAKARLNPIARDEELGRRLWELSESMCGISYLSER